MRLIAAALFLPARLLALTGLFRPAQTAAFGFWISRPSSSPSAAARTSSRRAQGSARANRFAANALCLSLVAAAALAIDASARAEPAGDNVFGRWKVQSGRGVVEIARCGATICGTIVAGDPQLLDVENDDPALRNRPLLGLTMLSGYRQTASGWVGGTIYNPEDGGTYSSELRPGANGALLVKGCFAFLCRTQKWTRAN